MGRSRVVRAGRRSRRAGRQLEPHRASTHVPGPSGYTGEPGADPLQPGKESEPSAFTVASFFERITEGVEVTGCAVTVCQNKRL